MESQFEPLDQEGAEIRRLEGVGASAPDSPAFAALAEAHRRAGRVEDAERIAREGLSRHPRLAAGRVALGLALLDLGREAEARGELERVLDMVPDHPLAAREFARLRDEWSDSGTAGDAPSDLGGLEDAELELAFQSAEPERDAVVDADRIALEAIRGADLGEAEEPLARSDSPFATRTVADLLERQGHERSARAVRSAVERRPDARAEGSSATAREGEVPAARRRRGRAIAKLERWLERLRRGDA